MKPEVIGIGAQKCASSWIHAILGAHPDVGVSDPKEVDFFSYYFDRGYGWYEAHFAAFADKIARFESSPSYFYDPRAPQRAATYNPALKVLALLRNPIERAYSNHLHEVVKCHIPACPFEVGVENNPTYLEQGRYATHLTRWFDAFPREQVKVMFAEDISKDPAAAAAEVFEFIGVDSDFVSGVFSERRNESDRAKHPALRSTLRAGGDWLRRQGLEEHLTKLKSTPPVAAILKYNKVEVRDEIPKMRPDTRSELVAHFAPEMTALKSLLPDQPLPWDDWAEQ